MTVIGGVYTRSAAGVPRGSPAHPAGPTRDRDPSRTEGVRAATVRATREGVCRPGPREVVACYSLHVKECPSCSYPNPGWRRRCDRCGRPIHGLRTHLLVWGTVGFALGATVLALLG